MTNNKINVIITIYFKTLIGRVAFCRCLREPAAGGSRHKQIVKNTHESLKESNKQVDSGVSEALIPLSELILSANLGGTTEAVFRPMRT